jgi:hypothetical protein
MEAGAAVPSAKAYYENNKEHVWNMARAVLARLTHHR